MLAHLCDEGKVLVQSCIIILHTIEHEHDLVELGRESLGLHGAAARINRRQLCEVLRRVLRISILHIIHLLEHILREIAQKGLLASIDINNLFL